METNSAEAVQTQGPVLPTNSYEMKQLLNTLSKEVFGSSSRWQKLVNKGVSQVVTEEVTELVPRDDDSGESDEQKVRLPVKTPQGTLQYQIKRYSLAEVYQLMTDLKKRREDYIARLKKNQEEQAAAKAKADLEKKVHDDLAGSAGL